MKKLFSLILAGVLFSCSAAPAMAVTTSFGRSSSSFSRSYSAPRTTYSAPKPAPTVTKNVTVNKTTVVHEGGGSSGNGLLTGMMVGSMMSNANRPVVVEQAPVVAAPAPVVQAPPQAVEQAPQPIVQQDSQESSAHGFMLALILVLCIALFVYFIHHKKD